MASYLLKPFSIVGTYINHFGMQVLLGDRDMTTPAPAGVAVFMEEFLEKIKQFSQWNRNIYKGV